MSLWQRESWGRSRKKLTCFSVWLGICLNEGTFVSRLLSHNDEVTESKSTGLRSRVGTRSRVASRGAWPRFSLESLFCLPFRRQSKHIYHGNILALSVLYMLSSTYNCTGKVEKSNICYITHPHKKPQFLYIAKNTMHYWRTNASACIAIETVNDECNLSPEVICQRFNSNVHKSYVQFHVCKQKFQIKWYVFMASLLVLGTTILQIYLVNLFIFNKKIYLAI